MQIGAEPDATSRAEAIGSTASPSSRASAGSTASERADRERLEATLRKSEADLKDAQRLASLGNWSWDAATDHGAWSEEMYRIFARDPSLPPLGYEEYLARCTRESAAALRAVVDASMRTGAPYELDLELVDVGEGPRWVTERGVPVRDEAGAIVGLRGTTQDISARKRAEEQLRRASAYARSLLEASLDPLVTISPDGKITDLNRATEEATGAPRAALVGTDFADCFTEPERAREGHRLALARGFVRDFPLTIRNPRGRDVHVHYNARVYRDETGAIAGVFAAARDVTERARALAALERERDFNVAVLGTVASLVIVLDLEGRIVVFNKACEECTGWAFAEVVGKPFFELLVPEREREAVRGVWARLATTALPSRHENHWLTRRGEERLVEFANATLKKPDGAVEYVISAGTDVTDRRRAEADLRESEARLMEAQRIAHIGNWEHDLERDQLVWSPEVFRIFELDPRAFEATYAAIMEVVHPDDRAVVDRAYRDSVERHAPYDLVHRLSMKDGRIKFVNARGETIYGDDGRPRRSLGTVQDITDRKRAEEALQRLAAELEARVRQRTAELEAANKELEGFSYSVSHDLRSPLRAIDGFSRIVMANYGDELDAEGRRLLGIVRENTVRMGHLIDDILAFSRAGRLELRGGEVDVTALVRDVWQELEPAREGRDVRLTVGELPRVRGDAAMIRQVLANLLGNAVKFTSKKPTAHVEIGATIEGELASFFVRDDGVGFDPRYVHKLFGVFQRLHGLDEFEGTGIGLAIVKRIVTRHGGTVRAEGAVDAGATIHFTLPLAKG